MLCVLGMAAPAVAEALPENNPKLLGLAQKSFVKQHGTVFKVLGAMQTLIIKQTIEGKICLTLS